MSVERENAVIDNEITLKCNFKFNQTGDLFNPASISKVEILDSDGTTVIETITGVDIVNDSTGKYHVVATAIATAKTIYDKWTFVPVTGATAITQTNTCIVWSTAAGSSADLTTATAFKVAFSVNATTHDTLIANTVTEISKYIQNHPKINQDFLAAVYTEYYNGDGGDTLILRKLPVNSITSIHDDVDRAYATASLMDADDYMFDDESGIVTADGDVFSKGKKNIQVIYNAGYTSIPADVKLACEKLVMAEFCEKVTGVNTGVGDDMIYKPSKLRTEAGKMLEAYFKS